MQTTRNKGDRNVNKSIFVGSWFIRRDQWNCCGGLVRILIEDEVEELGAWCRRLVVTQRAHGYASQSPRMPRSSRLPLVVVVDGTAVCRRGKGGVPKKKKSGRGRGRSHGRASRVELSRADSVFRGEFFGRGVWHRCFGAKCGREEGRGKTDDGDVGLRLWSS